MKNIISRTTALVIAGVALTTISVPGLAQTDGEELVVTGRYGPSPDSLESLSQAVSYHDLDLSTKAGQTELRHRLKLTARYLCGKLGEPEQTTAVGDSCQQAAVKDAMSRVGTLEAHAVPRGTGWVAGTAWAPPYPVEWVTRYPE